MTFLITFIVLSIINVIFSTVRSITTIKGSTLVASLVSGGYFAFYNIMLIYTVADFRNALSHSSVMCLVLQS